MICCNFSTSRLACAPISDDDLDDFYAAFVESFVHVTAYYRPAWSRYEAIPPKAAMVAFINSQQQYSASGEAHMFSVRDKASGAFIGLAELHSIDLSVPKARLGYWVRDRKAGQGYATEMALALSHIGFDWLQCRRLEIRNEIRNPAGGAIACKIGYDFLTIFEKNKQGKPGDFWDLKIYACLSKDKLPDMDIEYHD